MQKSMKKRKKKVYAPVLNQKRKKKLLNITKNTQTQQINIKLPIKDKKIEECHQKEQNSL